MAAVLLIALLGGCASEPSPAPRQTDSTSVVCGAEPLTIPVGASVRPAPGATGCTFAFTSGADYALAVLDPAEVRAAEGGVPEPLFSYSISLSVTGHTAAVRSSQGQAPLPARAAPAPAPDVIDLDVAPRLALADEPLSVDQQFSHYDDYTGAHVMARVKRVYDDHFVVAWLEQGDASRLVEWLPRLDTAFAAILQHGVPLMRSALADALPRSRAGQYLILLRDTLPWAGAAGLVGQAFSSAVADTVLAWVYIKVDTTFKMTGIASLVAHEMTHSFQRMYMHASRGGAAQSYTGAARWGVEGGANLLSYEMMRRWAGIPLDGNRAWATLLATPVGSHVYRRAQPADGQFTDGYDAGMGLLRRLVLERMAAGEATDAAVRAVARGALEGWFGYDGLTRRQGLTDRMRALLRLWWHPAEALLDWTLSHAADDLTPNPVFQDRASLRVWDIPPGVFGWRPFATFGSSLGGDTTVLRAHGSPVFAILRDEGHGVQFTVNASYDVGGMPGGSAAVTGLRWKVVRIR